MNVDMKNQSNPYGHVKESRCGEYISHLFNDEPFKRSPYARPWGFLNAQRNLFFVARSCTSTVQLSTYVGLTNLRLRMAGDSYSRPADG